MQESRIDVVNADIRFFLSPAIQVSGHNDLMITF